MEINNYILAFGFSLFAGLSTGIGSLLAFFTKKTNTKALSVALGFSAGVMIYVSMAEIYSEAQITLSGELGARTGGWAAAAGFFGGMLLIALIDRLVPKTGNPHELRKVEDKRVDICDMDKGCLMRLGVFTAAAIALHNFPEGLATFTTTLKDPRLGIAIAVAVAIHNIPEGIAVSMPIYYATGDRKKAFRLSFLSGLAEPLGAAIGYLLLYRYMNDVIFGLLFAAVAGIMVFISLDELLPTARRYGEPHLSIYGLIAGMMVMALSLLLFL
ncbi:MAG: zinc transporter ZupT [Eubacteriales bacterium]|nr:zinc transporter ZupT [Eubacteriales bacterium]